MSAAFRWAVVAGLLTAGSAFAQFGNRSIGASVGYARVINRLEVAQLVPVGLYYTGYLENGFEVILRANGTIAGHAITPGVFGFAALGGLGVRKLFMEEQIRPYVAIELSALVTYFGAPALNVGGTGALGVELMVAREISVGARGQYTVFPLLMGTWVHALEVTGTAAVYF